MRIGGRLHFEGVLRGVDVVVEGKLEGVRTQSNLLGFVALIIRV